MKQLRELEEATTAEAIITPVIAIAKILWTVTEIEAILVTLDWVIIRLRDWYCSKDSSITSRPLREVNAYDTVTLI